MGHPDPTAIAAAGTALLLSAGVWALDGWERTPRPVEDQAGLARASQQVLEFQPRDMPVEWLDRQTGTTAIITAAAPYQDIDGRWCRPYRVALRSKAGTVFPVSDHVSCREPGGRWIARTDNIPPGKQLAQRF